MRAVRRVWEPSVVSSCVILSGAAELPWLNCIPQEHSSAVVILQQLKANHPRNRQVPAKRTRARVREGRWADLLVRVNR